MSSSIATIVANTHIFFCTETDCNNIVEYSDWQCDECCPPEAWHQTTECPGCGIEQGVTLLGMNNYCGSCWQQRHGCSDIFSDMSSVTNEDEWEATLTREPKGWYCTCNRETGLMCGFCSEDYKEPCWGCEPTHVCSGEWDYELGYRVCDNSDDEDCPQHEPQCTCGVSSHLWTDEKHCRKCYVKLHGDEFPPLPPSPPRKTLEEMRNEIAEIEFRLLGKMTKNQKDDWRWLLQNRRADLAEAEKGRC